MTGSVPPLLSCIYGMDRENLPVPGIAVRQFFLFLFIVFFLDWRRAVSTVTRLVAGCLDTRDSIPDGERFFL
jgi:hypothetical protein